jgi:hypothetical protein
MLICDVLMRKGFWGSIGEYLTVAVTHHLGRVEKLHLYATAAIFSPVCVSEALT